MKKHKKNFLTGEISKDITNFQIETALIDINDPGIDGNFVGVFEQIIWIDLLTTSLWCLEKSANILSS